MREPRRQPGVRVGLQLRRLTFAVARKARQDRLALWRHERATLRDDQRVADRLGQVRKRILHRLGGFQPGFGARYASIFALDIGRLRDAQHRIRSETHTSELQSLMRTSYAAFCLKKK